MGRGYLFNKRYIFVFILLLGFTSNVYPFWIWSPKTKKWKNPKYSPLPTPSLQFKEALKLFNEGEVKKAIVAFKKVIIHYPDAQEAAEAQYYLGQCYEKLGKFYRAFTEYQKLIKSYPNSARIDDALEREYAIGEIFLNRPQKELLGISVYDVIEHPSIEIFKQIVDNAPYSKIAIKSQYRLGMLLKELGRLEEARDAFQKLIDNYPDSEWAESAKYQLALVTANTSLPEDYDQSLTQEAKEKLEEFVKKHPEMKLSDEVRMKISALREKEAKKHFDIASFYEKQGKYKSAKIYYKIVVNEYFDTKWADKAKERLKELENDKK